MNDHDVVIAGGGPTGLMLAAELALANVDVVIVESRPSQDLDGRKAGGLHARTTELLDQRGVAERFVAAGQRYPFVGFAGTALDISDLPTRHNYMLALWQVEFERIMATWLDELEVPIVRSREVTEFAQHSEGIDVKLSDGSSFAAEYLVGCDGGRSAVRKRAGIEFPGWDATSSFVMAEVEMTDRPPIGMRPEGGGIGPVKPSEPDGPYGLVLLEPHVEYADEPTAGYVSELLEATFGTDFGMHTPTRISRFTDMCRQAASYRSGRVLVAGDAAHVHGPQAGQGLNTGVQDAVNLGWKLAQVIKHNSPDNLLDTYHAERHPVGARVLQNTMAQVALTRIDDRSRALREMTLQLLALDAPRMFVAGMISGLDIRYDLDVIDGDSHPLLGRRMPDLDLEAGDGPTRVFALLCAARPVLLNLDAAGGFDPAPWSDRVTQVDATYTGEWELPLVGAVSAPSAVLIRPDGYVVWVGSLDDPALHTTIEKWFGVAH